MTLEQKVLEKLQDLPPEKPKVILGFVQSLKKENGSAPALQSGEGLWADLAIHRTEDVAESRRGMSGNFPRDIEP